MAFYQDPPALGNQYEADRVLRSYLGRTLSPDVLRDIEPELSAMGELAGGELYRMQLEDRLNEPKLTPWDAWGRRVDRIELTPLWKRCARIAAEQGLIATAYEQRHGALSRIHQFALVYLFDPSSDVYTCPLAMTDGAAKTLVVHRPVRSHEDDFAADAYRRLVSRTPEIAWTSGQWMTERTGGSDVGLTETIARPDEGGKFRLYGTKWFTSATTSQMALTLARPEGNPSGGRGLALFYVEVFDDKGLKGGILVNRLKDKLGTRKVPTAELTLDGALAVPVKGLTDGIRNISPMLNVTRTWNAIGAIAGMRRGLALARDYARRRVQFGAPLSDKPLHTDTLADLQAEYEGAFHLTFRAVELLGREEAGDMTESEARLLRLVTPLAKLTTGKQTVAVLSEVLECFGGAGYVEDTGLPRLLRDAQVLPIWEGTTNVLSLDALRAIQKERGLEDLLAEIRALVGKAKDAALVAAGKKAIAAAEHAAGWLVETAARDLLDVEAGARRFALTLGRAYELALLVRHAQYALDDERDGRARASALRFASRGVDLLRDEDRALALALANDTPLEVDAST
ncbi:acyl-CoA dehydrogenase family protein [Polyangium aurulentum]|uniref:acyl-CoA dehydrogenase family protein n=1 Tax=Polyangium aurulentum TaxID=2567896 RepID=UPI0010ADD28A|nr:acyl-CoA dehydrogenase family protein [Polyangium aurulentum]UQA63402.1 acyl-CoA dehydrogenase family protein [Polyangium aurulentum]